MKKLYQSYYLNDQMTCYLNPFYKGSSNKQIYHYTFKCETCELELPLYFGYNNRTICVFCLEQTKQTQRDTFALNVCFVCEKYNQNLKLFFDKNHTPTHLCKDCEKVIDKNNSKLTKMCDKCCCLFPIYGEKIGKLCDFCKENRGDGRIYTCITCEDKYIFAKDFLNFECRMCKEKKPFTFQEQVLTLKHILKSYPEFLEKDEEQSYNCKSQITKGSLEEAIDTFKKYNFYKMPFSNFIEIFGKPKDIINCEICTMPCYQEDIEKICSNANCFGKICKTCVVRQNNNVSIDKYVSFSDISCPFCRCAYVNCTTFRPYNICIVYKHIEHDICKIAETFSLGICCRCKIIKPYKQLSCTEANEIFERNFRCEHCSKHGTDRVIPCGKCGNYLLKIIYRNDGGKDYSCNHMICNICGTHICGFDECFQIFDNESNCYYHMRSEHKSYYDADLRDY